MLGGLAWWGMVFKTKLTRHGDKVGWIRWYGGLLGVGEWNSQPRGSWWFGRVSRGNSIGKRKAGFNEMCIMGNVHVSSR